MDVNAKWRAEFVSECIETVDNWCNIEDVNWYEGNATTGHELEQRYMHSKTLAAKQHTAVLY